MSSQGDASLPPFPFGELPALPDAPANNLPSWLALTGAPSKSEGELSVPSIPYWPGSLSGESDPELEPQATAPMASVGEIVEKRAPVPDQSTLTERIRPSQSIRRAPDELPLPPPFSAGLSELTPFTPRVPSEPIEDSQPLLTRTPPPADPLQLPPASAIWRSRRITATPRIEDNGTIAVFRTVIRDEAGRGFENTKVTFPLPNGIKQVQASRKPVAKKGSLHWNLGPLGPGESIPLSVKIPVTLLAGREAALQPRHFEVVYQPLPGARLVGDLSAPSAVLIGEPFKIAMKVTNAGELPTANVTVRVSDRTSGGKPAIVTTQPIAPGESRTVSVELISRVEGRHDWLATVESSGCEPAESIFSTESVRVALALELRHESMMRVDQEEEIALVIRNVSPVPARGVSAMLTMPEELTFASAVDGQFDRSLNLVGWLVGDIPPGETRTVTARLRGFAPGLVGIQARAESLAGPTVGAASNIFVEIDARSTSSSLDKLLAAIEESTPDDTAEERERPAQTGIRHLVFELAGAPYAVAIDNIREVLRPTRTTPVPGMPEWLPGVANVRGDIVTIVDLPLFLGVRDLEAPHRGLLIAESEDRRLALGLLVGNIVGIRRLPATRPLDREPFRDNPLVDHLQGMADQDGRLVPILALESLLRATEVQTV